MPQIELFSLFVRPINVARIRYVIGGSVAAIFTASRFSPMTLILSLF